MQKKLQLTTLGFLWIGFLDFLSGFHECLLHKKIKGKILTFLLLLFSISGYSQLATENFEGGIPASWTLFQNSVGTSSWGISNDGYLGSKAAFIDPASENIGAGNTAQYFLVTPLVPVPENGELRFFTKQGSTTNNGTIYQIRLSTASQPDINGFSVVLKSWTEAELNTGSPVTYEEKVVPIPDNIPVGLNVYIAFVAVNTQTGASPTGDSWFVDNVRVVESCLKVQQSNFTASNITAHTANLSWTHPTATSFEIQVVPQGTAPAANGTTTSNSYPASSLAADTFYDVYIRTNCGGSVPTSEWAGPFSFKTGILGLSCDAPIVIPDVTTQAYTLSTNLNLYQNPAVTYTTHGSGCLSPAITNNYLNGAKAFLTYTPTVDGLITITQTTLGGTGCFNNSTGVFVYQSCSDVGVSCIAGMNTSAANVPKRIPNLFVQAGHTYIIVVSSNLTATASICFNLKVESSTCPAPATFTYKNLLQNSVAFSWDNVGGFATAWEYAAVPTGSGAPTGAVTSTTTNIDNVINTGLAPGTTYDLYVRSVCNSVPGNWSLPYKFTTQCTVFNTPYSTQFTGASATVPTPCWTGVDVNMDGLTWSYLGGYATMQTNTYQNYNNDMFVSPQVNVSGAPKRLRFKHQVVGGVSSYAIRISTTGIGAQNFTIELMPDTPITNTTWVEKIINIPTSITGPINIAWIVSPSTAHTATRISIDDVFIEDKPACPDPLSPTAQNVTEDEALLSWINGDTESQWQVSIQPYGTGVPTGNGVLVNSNPYLATNLNPATHYEYYVRAYCSATQVSNWVGPFDFTTACITFPTPFTESFNDTDPTTKKFCWTTNNANSDGVQWTMGTTEARIQRGFMGPNSFDDWLITPAINAVGNKKLTFKYRALLTPFTPNPRHGIQVLISTTDTNPASFTEIAPLMEFTNTVYQEKSLYFTGSGTVYIAFRVPPELVSPGTASTLNLDDVVIEDAPACPNPSDLTATNITADTATLSWTPGYAELAWEVKVQLAGTGIPTGSGTPVTTTATHAPTDLLPNTVYEYYVRAACGSAFSDWIGPFTFRTLCSPFNTPFVETFNSDSTSEDCWRIVNNNNDANQWNLNVTVNPYEGNQMAGMFTGSNGENEDWLISPTINVTANQRLRYYYRVNDSFFTEDLKVKLSTNGIALDQFTVTLYDSSTDPVLINNMEYKEKIINLPPGITGNINIAFQVPFYLSTEPYRGQLLFIDNVVIEDIPACPQPSNAVATNLTDVEVQLSWDANGTSAPWEIAVQPFGTPAPVGNAAPQYLYTANTNPYTVTGLTPATKYEYYIRSLCGASGESEWIGPFVFTTRCSFENLCEYTISLTSGSSWGVGGGIDVMQNGVVVQTLQFPTGPANQTPPPAEYTVLLCTGVEYSLFWDSIGTAPGQYPNAQVQVKDGNGDVVWTSPLGLGTPRTVLYTGVSTCGTITCPQPTNLQVSAQSVFSWTPGGSETQWEVSIQPVGNGTLPQSGTIVNTTSYTPQPSDFDSQTAATYEYFVRAICSGTDKSFWSGPKVFVRNDEPSTALVVPVNQNEECNSSVSNVTFSGATPSSVPMTCGGINGGDIWFEFVATSRIHIIEANGFTGNFYISSGDEPYPNMMMTLYKVGAGGVLEEKACSNNNTITAMYSLELEVGNTYKVRLTLNSNVASNRKFNVCIKTPADLCNVDAVNYDFEHPPMQSVTGITTISTQYVVPGWRVNLDTWEAMFFSEALNAINSSPYSGGQCIQLLSDPEEDWNPNDPNIKGLYKEFDTSEITQMKYSFAHAARAVNGSSVQLYAGPPSGPFTLVTEVFAQGSIWNLHEGTYNIPAGQNVTRFIFRSKENIIGNLLDAANFKANNEIMTTAHTLNCSQNTTTVEAEGAGQWTADANNPGTTVITTPNNKTTTITGFTTPGVYTFYWKTRYCEKSVVITYEGITEMPTVTSPVVYCQNETAVPLTATAPVNYSLLWFTEATGGNGSATAPIPVTTTVGNTSYYVSLTDANGCQGPRQEIVVQVNALPTATITAPAPICSGTTATVVFNGTPDAVITYTVDGGTNQTITLDANGTASATTPTLTVNSVYTLVNVTATNSCTQNLTDSVTVNVMALPTATISGTATICSGDSATITFNGTVNATVTYTMNGGASQTIVLDATGTATVTTGALTAATIFELVSVASANSSCTATVTGSAAITINPLPTATISGTATICTGSTTTISFVGTPNAVVTYTVDGGTPQTVTLDANGNASVVTGVGGVYTIINVTASGALACNQSLSDSITITVTPLATPTVTFSYDPTCVNATTSPLPTLANGFATGGTFSSTTLTVNPTTGAIDLTSATGGTHQIEYNIAADLTNCTDVGHYIASIVLTTGITPVTDFSYDPVYCPDSPNALPQTANNFTHGGTFGSTPGLSINTTTGEINIAASTPGSYTITYSVQQDAATCNTGGSDIFNITITQAIAVAIESGCENETLVLRAVPVNGSFNPDTVTYIWKDQNNITVGTNEATFNVDQYMAQNPTASLPLTFSVIIDSGSCTGTTSFPVTSNPCRMIPKGISPNNDGSNDSFDLTGMGVRELSIFNRYGTEVYKFNGNYTNQWNGTSNNGTELPDGTYFYTIVKENGTKATGWVYINREQ